MFDNKLFCDACGWQIEDGKETYLTFKSKGNKSPLFAMTGNSERSFLQLELTKVLCEECAKDILYYVHFECESEE